MSPTIELRCNICEMSMEHFRIITMGQPAYELYVHLPSEEFLSRGKLPYYFCSLECLNKFPKDGISWKDK